MFCYSCSFVDGAPSKVTVSYSLAGDDSDPDRDFDLAYPNSDSGEAEVLQTGNTGAQEQGSVHTKTCRLLGVVRDGAQRQKKRVSYSRCRSQHARNPSVKYQECK